MIISVATTTAPTGPPPVTGASARHANGFEGMTANQETSSAVRQIPLVDNKVKSSDLFQHGKELSIVHNDEIYKLRLTGNSKLILTK